MFDRNCVFCKIANGVLKADIIYKSDHSVVFSALSPVATFHKLVIPKKHIISLGKFGTNTDSFKVWDDMLVSINKVVQIFRLKRFKLVSNNSNNLQRIAHLHFHLISGKSVSE